MRRKDNQQSLKDIIDQCIRGNSKLSQGLLKHRIISSWHSVVGDHISKRTLDIYYGKSTVYVKLASSTLKNELSYQKQTIIDQLNEAVRFPGAVKDVVFT